MHCGEYGQCGCRQQRPKTKLYDPDDTGERWAHDKFEMLDMPPEMDDYMVRTPAHMSAI